MFQVLNSWLAGRSGSFVPSRRRLVGLAFFAVLAGCGKADPDRVAVFPVEGSVSLCGKPIPSALVVLHPKNPSDPRVLPARGYVDADGKFTVSTYEGADGAAEGEYAVTVTLYQPIRNGDGAVPGPNVLPRKYENPATTDLVVRVAEGAPQLPTLELRR